MKIAIPKERRAFETRVAASPDTVKKFVGLGCEVLVEKDAGLAASFTDEAFVAAGASIAKTPAALYKDADVVLKVQRPMAAEDGADEIAQIKKGTAVFSMLQALTSKDYVGKLAEAGIDAFAMELMPRISRAQSMDVLSSQSNLAGYKAVIDAAAEYNRALPMMMTAAGTVPPARVLVMGAGVAGLQAIATAKRLGAVVYAFDVRAAAKEQVESLGGKFVIVDEEAMKNAETKGGYAKEMGDDYKKKQAQATAEQAAKADIIICTALIPGRPAPVLITEEMVKGMKPGSVIVDLAVEMGGNCPLSEYGKIVTKHGVILMGHANVPGRVASDASMLYAKNIWNFVSTMIDKETKALKPNLEDELVQGTLVCRDGKVVHPALAAEGGK
ncbi:Re/Si-specific NAD(P)(+) transhydrogenase subunit alpha [Oleispirillum naphthae]|uniref:Re/Si-specific NAD(P)(+) transhydrogenase subunit alpha n=1 Tax=Oleispirillum naphthae TaxID=2838853 RepID=UPI0030824048